MIVRRTTLLVAGLAMLLTGPASAANKNGAFAIKGAGRASCERFVAARSGDANVYGRYVGWLEGYLSSFNQNTDDTVDILPWQQTSLIAALVEAFCKRNPKVSYLGAVSQLLRSLEPQRLRNVSEMVEAKIGDKSVAVYKAVLRRIQQNLTERGLYTGEIDGLYGTATRKAIEAFQSEKKIAVTSLPDQQTLFHLFR